MGHETILIYSLTYLVGSVPAMVQIDICKNAIVSEDASESWSYHSNDIVKYYNSDYVMTKLIYPAILFKNHFIH